MPLTLASNAITFTDNTSLSSGVVGTAQLSAGAVTFDKISQNSGPFNFRNKIINGDMRIDQRRNGVLLSDQGYVADRWACFGTQSSTFTIQRLSADGPAGFTTSSRITLNSTRTPAAGDIYGVVQRIETQNLYDLQYGTVNARPVTMSFWVKSSITGTYAARIAYSPTGSQRTYAYTYNINQANTWEYKTITIPGETVNTLPSDPTGIGLDVLWNLGTGSSRSTSTPNQWESADFHTVNGTVSFASQSPGATWQIANVQLEIGSVATPFEQRPIGLELSLCQRYYQKSSSRTDGSNAFSINGGDALGYYHPTGNFRFGYKFPIIMRSTPNLKLYDSVGTIDRVSWYNTSNNTWTNNGTIFLQSATPTGIYVGASIANSGEVQFNFTADAEL